MLACIESKVDFLFHLYTMKVFTKLSILIVLSIFAASCSNSYVDDVDRSGGYLYRPGYPEVRLVTAGIVDEYTDSTKITVTGEIVYGSLVFKKVNGAFEANILVEVQILDNIDPTRIFTSKSYPITIKKSNSIITTSQDEYLVDKIYTTDPGRYTINFSVSDLNTNKQTVRTSEVYIPNPNDEVSHITNIRIFAKESFQEKNFQPVTTYDLSNNADSIRFEFQITNNYIDKPITIKSRLLKFNSDTTVARPMNFLNYNASHIAFKGIQYDKYEVINSSSRVLNQSGSVSIEFIFPNLERGNYRFEVTSDTDDGNELFKARDFSVKSIHYPSLKTPRELAAPLIYIMNKKDYEELMSIKNDIELKLAIDRFWLSNIKNSRKAQDVIALYYGRVEEANKQFSNFKEGWKTDMGMMYILFGSPWYTFNSLNRVKWSYSYDLNDFETNFFFEAPSMKNKTFPFDSYLLLRNQQYFNIQYQQIQKWLNGLILRDNL